MLDILFLVGGLALILLGANGLTDGAAAVAKRFNISDLVIGLTIVAFGTSAPELVISCMAALGGLLRRLLVLPLVDAELRIFETALDELRLQLVHDVHELLAHGLAELE